MTGLEWNAAHLTRQDLQTAPSYTQPNFDASDPRGEPEDPMGFGPGRIPQRGTRSTSPVRPGNPTVTHGSSTRRTREENPNGSASST